MIEKIITYLFAFIICSISIVGLFTDIPHVEGNLSNIILAVSSIILTTVAIAKSNSKRDHTNSVKKIEDSYSKLVRELSNNKNQIIKGLDGVEIVKFNSPKEQISYIINRLQDAEHSVSDLTWGQKVSSALDSPGRKRLESTYVTAIKNAAKRISYREIFIFSHISRIEKLENHYTKINTKNESSGYSCAYYEETNFPRLQFLLIDDNEVIFTSGQYLKCAVKSSNVVDIFTKYYSIAWDNANKLIENGVIVNLEEIEKIIEKGI